MLGGCIIGCAGNSTCYIECDKVFQDQLKVGNSILTFIRFKECPCNENCATGCPCNNYVCADDEISTSAILILSDSYEPNRQKPVLVDFNGRVDNDMIFTYEQE